MVSLRDVSAHYLDRKRWVDMRRLKLVFKKQLYRITDSMLEHIGIYSVILSAFITYGCFVLPLKRMELIPHIITYASCNLALIGFIFSIILGLRGGEIYSKIKAKYPSKVKQIYRIVFKVTLASAFCAIFAMLVYAMKVWIWWMKLVAAFGLCAIFVYMFIGTLLVFKVLIDLLIKDDK